MLKLVSLTHNDKNQNCETDVDPSHKLIDDLIAQVKYVHIEEVWQSRLESLMQPIEENLSQKRKYLTLI